MLELQDTLRSLGACSEARKWAADYKTAADAWQNCRRGDWMLWLLGKVSGGPGSDARRRLVLAACECARLSLHHAPDGEDRPRRAIEVVEAWARGEDGVTLRDVMVACEAAVAAGAYATNAVYAAHVAYAANTTAAAYAAYATAAANAAYAATEAIAQCADIVRRHYAYRDVVRVIEETMK